MRCHFALYRTGKCRGSCVASVLDVYHGPMIDFPITELLDDSICRFGWNVTSTRMGSYARTVGLRTALVPCPRALSGLSLSGLRWLLYAADGNCLRKDAATTGDLGVVVRGIAKGEPTARLARELGLSRKQLHTLRQRIQGNLNETAPTDVMPGTAFEADELYQNAGEKKHAAP